MHRALGYWGWPLIGEGLKTFQSVEFRPNLAQVFSTAQFWLHLMTFFVERSVKIVATTTANSLGQIRVTGIVLLLLLLLLLRMTMMMNIVKLNAC
jgi:hypothetical protein